MLSPSAFDTRRSLDLPRDRWKRPLIVPLAGGHPTAYTRVTTLVQAIEDTTNLRAWEKRLVLKGSAQDRRLLDEAADLDPNAPQDKQRLNRLAEKAASTAGAYARREKGTHLHVLTEHVDLGLPLPSCSNGDAQDIAAYMLATSTITFTHVERPVVISDLDGAGTPDRIGHIDGPDPDGEPAGMVIADLKTGSIEYGAVKIAAQLAAYSRGRFYDPSALPVNVNDEGAVKLWKTRNFTAEEAATAYSPLPAVNQRWGVIIHLPAGSGRCTLHWIDLSLGWKAARLALEVRDLRREKRALRPFAARCA